MSDFTGWMYDPNSRQYFHYSASGGQWNYQNGARINSRSNPRVEHSELSDLARKSRVSRENKHKNESEPIEAGDMEEDESDDTEEDYSDISRLEGLPRRNAGQRDIGTAPSEAEQSNGPVPPPSSGTLKLYCHQTDQNRPLEFFRKLAVEKYGPQASASPLEIHYFDNGNITSSSR
jgi:hypothetical protein